jgi:glyoxylase-like metal-dependent hydrolase (beta-lactamase superfamily II)
VNGAVVVVSAPGHTPGSVVVCVTAANGARYAFLGDLVWQFEGVQRRQERPWLMRLLADVSPSEVRQGIERMAAIGVRLPAITLVPAHDARAFAQLPEFDAVSAKE